MAEIDNYGDNSAQARDEESSGDSRDTRDENDDPLSFSICAREIFGKSYNLNTWMDELGYFLWKF